jgi:hypothetical protein
MIRHSIALTPERWNSLRALTAVASHFENESSKHSGSVALFFTRTQVSSVYQVTATMSDWLRFFAFKRCWRDGFFMNLNCVLEYYAGWMFVTCGLVAQPTSTIARNMDVNVFMFHGRRAVP